MDAIYPDAGDDPNPRCKRCDGAKRGKPLLGLTFIENMTCKGLECTGGTILDPNSGTYYNANMTVSPDGQRLTVRGYIGLSIFGQSQTWNRVRQ